MSVCSACGQHNPDESRFCGDCGASLTIAAAPAGLLGRVVAERYRVVRIVAEGGMGIVYEAEQVMGERTRSVALKTLLPELSQDQVVVSRFARECAVIASLEHPNIVRVYDFGKTDDGILYIAMEYVHGKSLGQLMSAGPIPLSRCIRIVEQICSALAEAHQNGIVHRDLKPDNIILAELPQVQDFVKLLDFGIAKRSSHGGTLDTKLTQQGMVLGTPPYMAPEQFSGEDVEPATDIYALSVIVYEMLCGKLPFEADTPWQWAHHHLASEPAPMPISVPKEVERVVLSGMSKLRAQRPASTREFFRQLCQAVREPSRAPRDGTFKTEPGFSAGAFYRGTEGATGVAQVTAPAGPVVGLSTVASQISTRSEGLAQASPEARPRGSRRWSRAVWGWSLGALFSLLLVAAGVAILSYADYFEDPIPPLPSAPAMEPNPQQVLVAGEPSMGRVVSSTNVTHRVTAIGQRSLPAGASSGVTMTTSQFLGTGGTQAFTLPIPFPIPTLALPNPFSIPPATTLSRAEPATPSTANVQAGESQAASADSCRQARNLAASNLRGAVDQYLACQSLVGTDAAASTRGLLMLQGLRQIRITAQQGRCADAKDLGLAMAKIGAATQAEAALRGTSCEHS